METLGAVSGATLGFIVNNNLGAYYGWRIGRHYGRAYDERRNMPPITRSRTQAGRRILSAMRGWRSRGFPGGSTGRLLLSLRNGPNRIRRRTNNVTTQQKDFSTQYKKKKAPRKFRKQWKKFVKKVTAVEIKNAALKTVVFNNKVQNTSNAGLQNYMTISLYGNNGESDSTNYCGAQDLLKIFDNETQIAQQGTGSPAVFFPINGKLHFGSAVLDLTLRNLGEVDAEVDVYYGYHVKDTTRFSTMQTELVGTLYDEFQTNAGNVIKSGNTILNLAYRGVTPFDLSRILSSSGFHVMKKQKFMMEPGKSVFLQHRDAANHELDMNTLSRIGYAVKKLTYQVLIVHKASVSSTEQQSTLAVGATRKYAYTVLAGANQPQNALNPTFDPAP